MKPGNSLRIVIFLELKRLIRSPTSPTDSFEYIKDQRHEVTSLIFRLIFIDIEIS